MYSLHQHATMSCLFHSIGVCLGLTQETVRSDIVNYMALHAERKHDSVKLKEWIEAAEDVGFEKYIEEMRKSSTWGGGIEMYIACLLYNANIVIHCRDGNFPIGDKKKKELHLKYTGNHFEPLGLKLLKD